MAHSGIEGGLTTAVLEASSIRWGVYKHSNLYIVRASLARDV